jgi:molybdenum cofactor synthesis domain-containing protein
MSERRAWIFTLGTEVVRGLVVNTNAAFLGRRLSQIGFKVEGVVSLVDDKKLIARVLRYVIDVHTPDLLVTSGGLGPTYDDLTLEAVAEALGRPLTLNDRALEILKEKLSRRGLELTKERLKMAYLPEGAEAIYNPVGTAPGALIRYGKTVLVCLPGVPREMEEMWLNYAEKIVVGNTNFELVEGSILVVGVPEATIAPILRRLSEEYSSTYIKSHPRGHEVTSPVLEIYISATSQVPGEARRVVKEVCEKLGREIDKLGGFIRESRC